MGSTMNPNIRPRLRGSNEVPSKSPRDAMQMHESGTSVTIRSQCRLMWASTPAACTTEAIGNTMAAEISPCAPPEITLEIATSQIGQGACTRSSISRVKPNSCASGMATAWMPWNMMASPTTPGTRTVAKADSAPGIPLAAPMPWPIFGKT